MLYPLVICYIAIEHPPMLLMGKSTISMVIFNSYLDITRPGKRAETPNDMGLSENVGYIPNEIAI